MPGQRDHLMIAAVVAHPVTGPQHRRPASASPPPRRRAHQRGLDAAAPTGQRAELVTPQQVEQHRQHRDRITRRLRAGHQRRRGREHAPQHLDRLRAPGGADAGSQPATARSPSRSHPAHRPAGTPTQPARTPAPWRRTSRRPAACSDPPAGSRPPPPSRPPGGRRSPARANPACPRHRSSAARTAATRCPTTAGSKSKSHQVIAFQPRLKPDMAAGRRRPPQPAQMPLALPGGEPTHRTAVLERHRPRRGQRHPVLGAVVGHITDLEIVNRADQSLGPRAITPSQLTVSAVEPTKLGSDSQPLTEQSQLRSQGSPEHRNLHPNRTPTAAACRMACHRGRLECHITVFGARLGAILGVPPVRGVARGPRLSGPYPFGGCPEFR